MACFKWRTACRQVREKEKQAASTGPETKRIGEEIARAKKRAANYQTEVEKLQREQEEQSLLLE